MLRSTVINSDSSVYGGCWSPDCQSIAYTHGKCIVIKQLAPNKKPLKVGQSVKSCKVHLFRMGCLVESPRRPGALPRLERRRRHFGVWRRGLQVQSVGQSRTPYIFQRPSQPSRYCRGMGACWWFVCGWIVQCFKAVWLFWGKCDSFSEKGWWGIVLVVEVAGNASNWKHLQTSLVKRWHAVNWDLCKWSCSICLCGRSTHPLPKL